MTEDELTADHEMRGEVRRALGHIGDAAMPPRSFDDLTLPTAVPLQSGFGRPTHRRAWAGGGVVAAAAVVVGLFVFLTADDDTERTTAADPTSEQVTFAAAWEEVPAAPLSPRTNVTVAWTGRETLVVGGDTFVCPPNASCDRGDDLALADGAAFDPATNRWREIAEAPLAFTLTPTVTLGDTVYFLVPDNDGVYADPGDLVLLRYSVAGDGWEDAIVVPVELSGGFGLLATEAGVAVYATSDELGEVADVIFDPLTGSWSDLPPDPLSPSFDRSMVWSGGQLYLFDHELVPNPGSERPSLTRAARLDLVTGSWQRLGDSEILGSGPWLVEGDLVVNPQLGCADGGEVNGWGRCYPNGGVYDWASDSWSELPNAPRRGDKDVFSSGAVGTGNALIYASGHPLYDASSGQWFEMPAVDEESDEPNVFIERLISGAGTDGFVFGGVRFDSGGGQLLGDAWIWRSGRTPAPVLQPQTLAEVSTPSPTPLEDVDSGPLPVETTDLGRIEAFRCPDNADCALGFEVDGAFYEVWCSAVRDDAIGDEVLATGDGSAGFDELRTLRGVEPSVLLAAHGSGCAQDAGDAQTWTAVRPPEAVRSSREPALALAEATCAVLVEPSPGDRCDSGGAARWIEDLGNYTEGYAYFGDYVDAIEAAGATDPDRAWRTDRVEVVRRYMAGADRDVCSSGLYPTCRVRIAAPDGGAGAQVVAGVIQWEIVEGSFETFPFSVTLERLVPGGETWWLTRYREEVSLSHGADRDAFDAAASCCPVTLIDGSQAN